MSWRAEFGGACLQDSLSQTADGPAPWGASNPLHCLSAFPSALPSAFFIRTPLMMTMTKVFIRLRVGR